MAMQYPHDEVFWHLDLKTVQPLREPLTVDILVVGGGMAGLSAAQSFHKKGYSVALVEKTYCGAGASGKSSGFITPDSELSLSNLADIYGIENATKLWHFIVSGVDLIKKNIEDYSLACDYQIQDTLVVANNPSAFSYRIKREHESRINIGYKSTLFPEKQLSKILGSSAYYGGVCYPDTFGINTFLYCQEMKKNLQKEGIKIFEETPVIKLLQNGAQTVYSTIKAEKVIVCIDRFLPELDKLKNEIYHAQTFLMMSSPLTDKEVKQIFPERNLMVWDTDLVYSYYRVTGNNRLLLGGSNLFYTYAAQEDHHQYGVAKKLTTYFKKKFPHVNPNFEYFWPGLIGLSKDIMPIAGGDTKNPNLYYISGAAGLPWASALGLYAAEQIIDNRHDLDVYFYPQRKFMMGGLLQKLLGTKLTFALCNYAVHE